MTPEATRLGVSCPTRFNPASERSPQVQGGPAPKLSGVQVRLRFAAALIAVLGGTGVASASPAVTDAFERAVPAAAVLAAMPRPAGVSECGDLRPDIVPLTHDLCWEGEADVVAATRDLVASLRTVGAAAVSPRCAKRSGNAPPTTWCQVSATILGEPFVAAHATGVHKNGDAYDRHGVFVSGGFEEAADRAGRMYPRGSAPVPLTFS